MHVDRLLPWFHLKSVPGIGNHLIKRLIDKFNCPEAVLQADPDVLHHKGGLSQRLVKTLKRHRVPAAAEAELERIHRSEFEVITYTDPGYPLLLKEIADPPPFLYVYGQLEMDSGNVAVVGSRHATGYGVETTLNLSADLARLGMTIVSGMALGIDTSAHEGALRGGGRTIAVLGSGLERIYPASNRKLFHRIAANGAVVSEFELIAKPEAHHFPLRNRVISGMSLGVVVVEASKKSGSLITARLAIEQNREVFAVPGSIQSFKSAGTHALIKAGAKLVVNAQDVIEELLPQLAIVAPAAKTAQGTEVQMPSLTALESEVLAALEVYPIHIDALQERTALTAPKLLGTLLTLELKGIVLQLPGKYFQRAGRKRSS